MLDKPVDRVQYAPADKPRLRPKIDVPAFCWEYHDFLNAVAAPF